jgi:hypothetical protein
MKLQGDNVSISLASVDEIPQCFSVLSKSFGHDAPFIDIYFPNHDTPPGHSQGSKRLSAWRQNGEASTFLKATVSSEDDDHVIVGLAIWTYMTTPPPGDIADAENVDEVWPDPDDRAFMARLWSKYIQPRTRAVEASGGRGIYGKLRLFSSSVLKLA